MHFAAAQVGNAGRGRFGCTRNPKARRVDGAGFVTSVDYASGRVCGEWCDVFDGISKHLRAHYVANNTNQISAEDERCW